MRINVAETVFPDNKYFLAAYMLRKSIKEMRKLHYYEVNQKEMLYLEIDSEHTFQDSYLTVKCISDCIYYNNNNNHYPVSIVRLLIAGNLLFNNNKPLIILYFNNYNNVKNDIDSIRANQRDVEKRARNISEITNRYFPLVLPDIKKLNKIMAKLKGKAEIINDEYWFTFYNIKSGNETEGYILYKNVALCFTIGDFISENHAKNIIFRFQNYEYDVRKWPGIVGNLHPHINTTSICFGNRADDWNLYSLSGNYEFKLDLIKTSLMSYNPESPYSNIITIRKKIDILNVIFKDYRKMNPATSPEEVAKHIFTTVQRCSHCRSVIDNITSYCIHPNCKANPDAIIKCRICGHTETKGDWIPERHKFVWICTNENCETNRVATPVTSPSVTTDINPDNDYPNCVICGERLISRDDAHLLCSNIHGSLGGIWQYERYNNGWRRIIYAHFAYTHIVEMLRAGRLINPEVLYAFATDTELRITTDTERIYIGTDDRLTCPIEGCEHYLEAIDPTDEDETVVYACEEHGDIYDFEGQRL